MNDYFLVFQPLTTAFKAILDYWWIYLPVVLAFVLYETWKDYTETKFEKAIVWTTLELTPPPDVQKSPKIAENFFSGLHGVYGIPVKWKKRFFEGKAVDRFSCEIVGDEGNTRFIIRTPEPLRNLVESHIFAQYPDAEIRVVDDYTAALPTRLPDEQYDVFGAELVFTKENIYPIKTYPFFEEESGKDEFKRTDPLAPLAELMSALKPGEHLWVQLVVRATNDAWAKKDQAVIDKITGKKPKIERDALGKAIDAIDSLLLGGSTAEQKKDEKEFTVQKLTPGQHFTLEQIENKIAKLAFESQFRVLYVAKRDIYDKARISTVIGMFKQLYSNNLNTFKPDNKTMTGTAPGWFKWIFPSDEGLFKAEQDEKRKKRIYRRYLGREIRKQCVILNTEELATVFHLPGLNVKAPFFPRVEAKKGQPPAGLPGTQVVPPPDLPVEPMS